MLGVLAGYFDHFHLTRYGNPRCVPPEKLAATLAEVAPGKTFTTHATGRAAWAAARAATGQLDLVCVTGSVFLAGELRAAMSVGERPGLPRPSSNTTGVNPAARQRAPPAGESRRAVRGISFVGRSVLALAERLGPPKPRPLSSCSGRPCRPCRPCHPYRPSRPDRDHPYRRWSRWRSVLGGVEPGSEAGAEGRPRHGRTAFSGSFSAAIFSFSIFWEENRRSSSAVMRPSPLRS